MAEGTDAPYRPNKSPGRMPALPDEMKGSPNTIQLPTGEIIVTGFKTLRPNDPAPEREPAPDRRPQILYAGEEFTEEYWTKRLADNEAKRNGQRKEYDHPTF